MKAYMGSRSTAPFILNLSTRGGWVVSLIPWPFHAWKYSPWYPLNKRMGRTHSQSELLNKRKIFWPCLYSNSRSSSL